MAKERNFRGIATAYGILCADGRTIGRGAFAHQTGEQVPLVYQHNHTDAQQVLGHAFLEEDGDVVYADCYFNNTAQGQNAAELVKHGDINALSIYAKDLKYGQGNTVMHGQIKEVSLVLSGANSGAIILNETIRHSDGTWDENDEACIIHSGYTNNDMDEGWDEGLSHAEESAEGKTVQDIYDAMTEEQQIAVGYIVAAATGEKEELQQSDLEGGNEMKHGNLFEKGNEVKSNALSHADCNAIFDAFQQTGSLKHSISQFAKSNKDKATAFNELQHAGTYGIDNIEYLYPDHQKLNAEPDFISRSMEWVAGVIAGTHKVPFSRFKMVHADITADEARAKGYIKGNQKVEEVFPLLRREVSATWIYKKQKMDQEEIIEVTDFNIVNWLWSEMNVMIREEIARAILIGDGRPTLTQNGDPNPDKIDETKLIPAAKDVDLYNMKVVVPKNDDRSAYLTSVMETVALKKVDYKGTGSPTFYTSKGLTDEIRIKVKDGIGHYMYTSNQSIASMMGCGGIVEVDGFDCVYETGSVAPEGMKANTKYNLIGLAINLRDYTVGTNRGGQLTKFSDFDIDRNQHKYLIETYLSGAINKPFAAITLWDEVEVTPTMAKTVSTSTK